MRILLTNYNLQGRSGTELYIFELALSLLKRGHLPVVYTPRLGQLGRELRSHTVPVTDDLTTLKEAPDVIHGHHSLPSVEALLRFPDVPGIFVCHDRLSWTDEPPPMSRFVRMIAVDHNCRDRLVAEGGIEPSRVEVFLNAVDTRKFKRRSPLPDRPERALVFSNQSGHLASIQAACRRFGLEVEQMHQFQDRGQHPEEVLGEFDVVFAKGRCALEALAVGCAVVVCDEFGLGPMVTSENFSRVRELNCGRRLLQQDLTEANITGELERYNPRDAQSMCEAMRENGSLEFLVDRWLSLYQEVIDGFDQTAHDRVKELSEAADFLVQLNPWIPELSFSYLWRRAWVLGRWWLKSKFSR